MTAHLDNDSVVRMLSVYDLCALRSDLAALLALDKRLIEQGVGSNHVVNNGSLTDLLTFESVQC